MQPGGQVFKTDLRRSGNRVCIPYDMATQQTTADTMDVRTFFGKCSSQPEPKPDIQTLVDVLEESVPHTARELAKLTGMERHRINQILYANPSKFEQVGVHKNAPVWSIV